VVYRFWYDIQAESCFWCATKEYISPQTKHADPTVIAFFWTLTGSLVFGVVLLTGYQKNAEGLIPTKDVLAFTVEDVRFFCIILDYSVLVVECSSEQLPLLKKVSTGLEK